MLAVVEHQREQPALGGRVEALRGRPRRRIRTHIAEAHLLEARELRASCLRFAGRVAVVHMFAVRTHRFLKMPFKHLRRVAGDRGAGGRAAAEHLAPAVGTPHPPPGGGGRIGGRKRLMQLEVVEPSLVAHVVAGETLVVHLRRPGRVRYQFIALEHEDIASVRVAGRAAAGLAGKRRQRQCHPQPERAVALLAVVRQGKRGGEPHRRQRQGDRQLRGAAHPARAQGLAQPRQGAAALRERGGDDLQRRCRRGGGQRAHVVVPPWSLAGAGTLNWRPYSQTFDRLPLPHNDNTSIRG
ncbi:Uncharacterised protein [Burkholderia pseudomallei]|nr:Uncharacterised protein [Burkholderia pseudomallei]CAJ3804879.1 Uncharacterised protein [Burkholderia pseudomallei]CAJ3881602.1 Uncharacterised protein [Burkholderia pseudomallei]CAJ4529381.1 Uncharacterised protein [Burkholderia pseudomallei]CAJ4530930.1 Uncharacterised protein [Burkholderia pseudomallei]